MTLVPKPQIQNPFFERDEELIEEVQKNELNRTEIARRFGISRERVRQIAEHYGLPSGRELSKMRQTKRREFVLANRRTMTVKEMAKILGVGDDVIYSHSRGLWIKPSPSRSGIGVATYHSQWFIEECVRRGLQVEPLGRNKSYHMIVNGHKVLVRSSHKVDNASYFYHFNVGRGEDLVFNFAVLICVDKLLFGETRKVFIVPRQALAPRHCLVGIVWPNTYNIKPKYADYFESWDLLKEQNATD